ncbi:hypothetical protein LCGC14_2252840, partial [marine sediment metagenome]
KTVEEFAKKLRCEGLMIVDDNTLIISIQLIFSLQKV